MEEISHSSSQHGGAFNPKEYLIMNFPLASQDRTVRTGFGLLGGARNSQADLSRLAYGFSLFFSAWLLTAAFALMPGPACAREETPELWNGHLADGDTTIYRLPALRLTERGNSNRHLRVRLTRETRLYFKYRSDGYAGLLIQFWNQTAGENYKTHIAPLKQNEWTSIQVNLLENLTNAARHGEVIHESGQLLTRILLKPINRFTDEPILETTDIVLYDAATIPAISTARSVESELFRRKTQQVFGIADPDYGLGVESSLIRVSGRHPLYRFQGEIRTDYYLSAAGREYEDFQIVLLAARKDLAEVRVTFTNLIHESGKGKIAGENFSWSLPREVRTKASYWYPAALFGWKPDPLTEAMPFRVRADEQQPVWISLYVPAGTQPGLYKGRVRVKPQNSHPLTLALKVRVWDYTLPLKGNFRTQGHAHPVATKKFPLAANDVENWRHLAEVMLRYRLSPTAQYFPLLSPPAEVIPFAIERGITSILVGGYFKDLPKDKILQQCKTVRDLGVIDRAQIYMGDEPSPPFDDLIGKIKWVRENCPGLKVMIGGSRPRPELQGWVDVWDPIMSMEPERDKTYGSRMEDIRTARQRGEEVFWYEAGRRPPYPGHELDMPAISLRMIFWISWKYGIDGWEQFGFVGGWEHRENQTWPDTEWNTYSWRSYNGNGQLLYPGPGGKPRPSIRMVNIRDGIEDIESLYLLRDGLEKLERKFPRGYDDLKSAARQLLAVDGRIVRNMWIWTRDVTELLAYRESLSSLTEKILRIVKD
jgi:hypothetical protein